MNKSIMKRFFLFLLMLTCVHASSNEHESDAANRAAVPNWLQRAGLKCALEVPFNNVAANTVPGGKTFADSGQHIWNQKGFRGFYSGSSLELARGMIWWPRMWLLEKAPGRLKDSDYVSSQAVVNLMTAGGITGLEAAFMPLFRLRNAMMLAPGKMTQAQLEHLAATLYSGTALRSAATFPSWFMFLYSNDVASTYFPNSKPTQMALTAGTQLAAAVATAPIYTVILLRQHPEIPCHRNFWDSISYQYKLHGLPLFRRVAVAGAGHLVLQGVLTNLVQK